MQEMIICRGIPASGKSTFANLWVTADKRRVRVSRDDIRILLFNRYTMDYEQLVTEVQNNTIAQALVNGFSVVVDNTNIRHSYVREFVRMAEEYEVPWSIKEFEVDVEEAVRRNKAREKPGDLKSVPEFIIRKMHKSLKDAGPVVL